LSLLDCALAAEMLGRSVAPVPFAGSSVMAPIALMGSGSQAQKQKYLPGLAAGKTIAGIAVSESASGAREKSQVSARNGKLSGRSLFVVDFAAADFFVVATSSPIFISSTPPQGPREILLTSIDATRAIGELIFENVGAEPLVEAIRRRHWSA